MKTLPSTVGYWACYVNRVIFGLFDLYLGSFVCVEWTGSDQS